MSAATFPTNISSSEIENLIGTRLENVVKGCTSRFTCGGTVQLAAPVEVSLLGGEGGQSEPIAIQVPEELRPGSSLPPRDYAKKPEGTTYYGHNPYAKSEAKRSLLFDKQTAELRCLTDVIPKAAFGKGGETVYDASVRDALQLKADKYELSIPQENIDNILDEIKRGMDLQTDIVAESYSLNVYRKGGKFVKHKDTPRGDDMLGTLVICLPTWFSGGKMDVSLGEETRSYFVGKKSYYSSRAEPRSPPDPCQVEWCAFFADVDHEIFTVEEGLRITATYLLRRRDQSSAASLIPRVLRGQEQADQVKECFLEGLRDYRFLSDGGKVGFPCLHLYTNAEVFPGKKDSSEALTSKQISKLKGRDLMIANAANAASLPVRLVPYLSHDYSMDGDGDYTLAKFPNKKRVPARMSDESIEYHFKTQERGDPDSEADLWILDFDAAASKNVGATEWNAEGYFGNEASGIDFYVKACLIIEVPEHSESRGVVAQTSKVKAKARKVAVSAPQQVLLSPGTQGRATSALQGVVQLATENSAGTVDTQAFQRAIAAGYSKHFILDKVARQAKEKKAKTEERGQQHDDAVIPAAVSED